ncbi:hypothetical protein NW063_01790 [Mycoplasmopsis cynos]|uniref:hypothetical protein n=1 Tax=Mycoplasmopsis cynos TaxID=171284 RepID=UPI0021FA135F|nr:hypothetical protein [Mycoplasmopsis cynos]UWV86447.1 hypothetical protein NW063_01790 [Mycoplasmopsis cynos]
MVKWKRKLFNGKALVIIQSTKTAGLIGLEASSTGLSSTSINLISSKNENTNIIPLGFENNNYVVLKNNELKLPKKLKVVYSNGKIIETDVVLDSANVKTSTPEHILLKLKLMELN